MSKDNCPQLANDGFYRFTIVKGNNHQLIYKLLEKRENWMELEQ